MNNQIEEKKSVQSRVEFNFPILTLRIQIFTKVFDKLGSFRASRIISWLALIIVPIVAGIGLYTIFNTLFTLLWTPVARDIGRELGLGAYLLLPGINPYLPILYGWIAIICAMAVHEGAHGVIARNLGFRIKSSGLLFLLFFPIGAFVEVDEKQIAKSKTKDSLKVMAAGVSGNIIVGVVCILSILIIVNGLTPVIDGVYIYDVMEDMPAEKAGLLVGDVFVSVDDVNIGSYDDFKVLMEEKNPGDVLRITVARGEMWKKRFPTSVNLTESEGRSFMGITLGDLMIEEKLKFYQALSPATFSMYLIPPTIAPGLVPFSDSLAPFYSHELGVQWSVFANISFWLWFVNINVAIFNTLPIYPLDGGRMFHILLEKILSRKMSEKKIYQITFSVTITLICVLLLIVIIPFIM